jgi:hypothetical protein
MAMLEIVSAASCDIRSEERGGGEGRFYVPGGVMSVDTAKALNFV